MLGDGRAGLDEVAAVDVGDPLDLADRRVVDVAADDTLAVAPLRLLGERRLELADEGDRVLHLEFRPGGKRPVGVAPARGALDCTTR